MHFSQLLSANVDPDLKLYGSPKPVVNELKFLGLIFDKKLAFKQHIRYFKDRCFKALNLLRVIAHKDWGADCATLLKLYRSHVRSKLDYGSARKSVLEPLDPVQNAALRTCLGAFRTSPVSSLPCGGGRVATRAATPATVSTILLQTPIKPQQPYCQFCFGTAFSRLFEARPHIIPSLGIRMHLMRS